MLFNSLEFLLFLPVVTALFFALPHERRWLLMLLASYAFYMAWEPAYGVLILISTAIDWVAGGRIAAATSTGTRRAWLLLSLATNLGLLFSFKYYNLFNDLCIALAASAGFDWPGPRSSLLLPVGISFYTFQTLSYTIDVYRGKQEPERSFGMFALFVSYFPQLVAGPVERAGSLLPQLKREVHWDADRVASGLRLAGWGLFKKVAVADRLAPIVDAVYSSPHDFSGFGYAVATVCFGAQIYCDFSGYSDMAIGIARIFGVDLMINFDQPHLARSLNDLWSRWHISMTTWFRDYIYVSLGGSRNGQLRRHLNIFLVMLASGLWHGTGWTFVAWGATQGVLLAVERATDPWRARWVHAIGLDRVPAVHRVLQWSITMAIWVLTLPLFRGNTIQDAWWILTHFGTGWSRIGQPMALKGFVDKIGMEPWMFVLCLALIPLSELLEYVRRDPDWGRRWVARAPALQWVADYALLFGILLLGRFDAVQFIYFQF